ncbi:MAG: DUF4275 family protein [Burkholderiaceae bacterium]|nr:DUF4275 family protein [Burkholderiaceae bacterium]
MAMKKHSFVERLSLKAEDILQIFSKAEAKEWEERWRAVYAANGTAPALGQFLWHTFSYAAYPSVCGEDAVQLYALHRDEEVIVLSNDRKTALRVTALPISDWAIDLYVFPSDLTWTMAFTHEDGWLGPYFAKHPDYAVRVEKTKRQRTAAERKAAELSRAKQKGWI